jgi:hypothetical protein
MVDLESSVLLLSLNFEVKSSDLICNMAVIL